MSKMFEYTDKICIICRADFDNSTDKGAAVNLRSKGLGTLREYSVLLKDKELTQFLSSDPVNAKVHETCRKRYTNKLIFMDKRRDNVRDNGVTRE